MLSNKFWHFLAFAWSTLFVEANETSIKLNFSFESEEIVVFDGENVPSQHQCGGSDEKRSLQIGSADAFLRLQGTDGKPVGGFTIERFSVSIESPNVEEDKPSPPVHIPQDNDGANNNNDVVVKAQAIEIKKDDIPKLPKTAPTNPAMLPTQKVESPDVYDTGDDLLEQASDGNILVLPNVLGVSDEHAESPTNGKTLNQELKIASEGENVVAAGKLKDESNGIDLLHTRNKTDALTNLQKHLSDIDLPDISDDNEHHHNYHIPVKAELHNPIPATPAAEAEIPEQQALLKDDSSLHSADPPPATAVPPLQEAAEPARVPDAAPVAAEPELAPSADAVPVPSADAVPVPAADAAPVPAADAAPVPAADAAPVPAADAAPVLAADAAPVPAADAPPVPAADAAPVPAADAAPVPAAEVPVPAADAAPVPAADAAAVPAADAAAVPAADAVPVPAADAAAEHVVGIDPAFLENDFVNPEIPLIVSKIESDEALPPYNSDSSRVELHKSVRHSADKRMSVRQLNTNSTASYMQQRRRKLDGSSGSDDRVSVCMADMKERRGRSSLLLASGDTIDVYQNSNTDLLNGISFVCKRPGKVLLHFSIKLSSDKDTCFALIMDCVATWGNFSILEKSSGEAVFQDGSLLDHWSVVERVVTNAQESVRSPHEVQFLVTNGGTTPPVVGRTSLACIDFDNSPLEPKLKNMDEDGALEPYGNRLLDVMYHCVDNNEKLISSYDTAPAVAMTVINESPMVTPIRVQWVPKCTPAAHSVPAMHLSIESCTNATAVQSTVPLSSAETVYSAGVTQGPFLAEAVDSYTVGAHDTCTKIAVTALLDQAHVELFKQPTLTYDKDALWLPNKAVEVRSHRRGVDVYIRYTCLDTADISMALELNFFDNSNIDIHWIKACIKPTFRYGRAFTARSGLLLVSLVVAAIALLCVFSPFTSKTMKFVGLGGQSTTPVPLHEESVHLVKSSEFVK